LATTPPAWKGAKPFRSAGSGGQRGAPVTGAHYQFSGSEDRAPRVLRGLVAAEAYRKAKASSRASTNYEVNAGQEGSWMQTNRQGLWSAGESSARRGQWRAERRFEGE
jgi:hypothetical protein